MQNALSTIVGTTWKLQVPAAMVLYTFSSDHYVIKHWEKFKGFGCHRNLLSFLGTPSLW